MPMLELYPVRCTGILGALQPLAWTVLGWPQPSPASLLEHITCGALTSLEVEPAWLWGGTKCGCKRPHLVPQDCLVVHTQAAGPLGSWTACAPSCCKCATVLVVWS